MKNLKLSTLIALVIALVMLIIGIVNKEYKTYFNKATMVCTQCIGLG